MVAAANAELYTPYSHLAEDGGVQSSEEGSSSDIHSPIFEAPYPPDVRYHLGHPPLPDAASASFAGPSTFDARYHSPPSHDTHTHLLETLQAPSTGPLLLPPQQHDGYGLLQHHPVLPVVGLSPPALSPVDGYAFGLRGVSSEHHPHLHQQHLRGAYETPSRAFALPMSDSKPPPSGPGSATSSSRPPAPPPPPPPGRDGNASGSNAPPAPSRQRREASTVVIACRQCRGRKIRCDSTRPVCNNCTRRGNECEYDAKPKRRGPDKRPGTRQRSCKKRANEGEPSGAPAPQARKRRKIAGDPSDDGDDQHLLSFDERDGVANARRRPLLAPISPSTPDAQAQAPPLVLDTHAPASGSIYPKDGRSPLSQQHSPLYTYDALDLSPAARFARPDMAQQHQRHDDRRRALLPPPSFPPEVEVPGDLWWDTLVSHYAPDREASLKDIEDDLKFLLENSGYWLFFFDRETFLDRLRVPGFRASIEPALILSALALSNLMQSSELGRGERGRARALALRNSAQSSMEAACNANRLHYTLAEAAVILALFEASCHPQHTATRASEALQFVDHLIRLQSLTTIDVGDPGVCGYEPRSIPIVYYRGEEDAGGQPYRTPARCRCVPSVPDPAAPHNPPHHTTTWSYNPQWDPLWTEEESRREECRRVCWSALNLVASYTAQSAAFHQEPMDLFLTEPANYLLLFPGEAYERHPSRRIPGQSPKDSVWALYCRSMLIWLSCLKPRDGWTTEERAEFAINAWHELQAVQSALDMHHCNLDTAVMYITREYLYNTRMAVSDEFRRLQDNDFGFAGPMFDKHQAREWVDYQAKIAQRAQDGVLRMTEKPGKLLTQRPFQTMWYMTQVAFCLVLWETEPSMTNALDLAKTFMVILDALNALWPCRVQQERLDQQRRRLTDACNRARLPPPQIYVPPALAARHF